MGQCCARLNPASTSYASVVELSECNGSEQGLSEEDDDDLSSRMSTTFGKSSRFEIAISHMKARGSVFEQPHCDFFLKFKWDKTERKTPSTKGIVSSKGCSWTDTILTFDYRPQESDMQFSQSLQELKQQSKEVLDKRSDSLDGQDKNGAPRLTVSCYGIRHHTLHKAEVWKLGNFSIDLFTVMSGPIHHVFKLRNRPEDADPARISYNVRIKQYAHWRIDLYSLKVSYDDVNHKSDQKRSSALEKIAEENVITEKESLVRPPSLSNSMIYGDENGVIESIKGRDYSVDTSKRYAIRYKLNDVAADIQFTNKNAVHPQVDSIGVSYKAAWDASHLPHIAQDDEVTFRSFLASSISFQVLEIRWEKSSASDSLPVLGRNLSLTQTDQRLEKIDSFTLGNEHGKLLGEVWIPVERLFENALEAALHEDAINARTNFKYELRLFGKLVGMIEGECEFLPIPGCLPLGRGVLTEDGISMVAPIVLNDAANMSVNSKNGFLRRFRASSSDFGKELSTSAQKLVTAIREFEKNFVKNIGSTVKGTKHEAHDIIKDQQIRACKVLLEAINTSEKESMIAFVYRSEENLLRMQQIMFTLWENLLEWVDTVRYSFRVIFFDILSALLMRGELGEHMIQSMIGGKGQFLDPESQAAVFTLRYRRQCYLTLAWALKKLGMKGNPEELRSICAKIVAIMTFRLPSFGKLVYETIVPENEMDIKEWSNSSTLKGYKTEGSTHFKTPEFYNIDYDLDAPNAPTESAKSENEEVLDWKPFHKALSRVFDKATLQEQEKILPMGDMKNGVFQAPMWLRRIQKHGDFFFLLGCEWMIYVLDTLGGFATSSAENIEGLKFQSGIAWHKILGYKHILKAFLLELRRRDLDSLPEAFRKLAMLLLVDDKLITTFAALALTKTNVYNIDNVTASLDLLSSWFTTLHGWPGRFIALHVFRKHGPVSAKQAENALQGSNSVFFNKMAEKHRSRLEKGTRTPSSIDFNYNTSEAAALLDKQTSLAPMAQMRALGSLVPPRLPNLEKPPVTNAYPGMYGGGFRTYEPEKPPEPYVTAWTFDMVSIYYPHLDVYRRAYKQSAVKGNITGGVTKNNNNSSCNWFSWLYADVPPVLHASFDYRLLLHSLYILLQTDHHQVVLKTIEFVYNHWDSLSESFQDRFREMILSSLVDPFELSESNGEELWRTDPAASVAGNSSVCIFLFLFFHWSDDVRLFFHTLVAYRLARGPKSKAVEKILAAVQLSLMSGDSGKVATALWADYASTAEGEDMGQFYVGVVLPQKFEGPKKKVAGPAVMQTRSVDAVQSMIKDISKVTAEKVEEEHDPNVVIKHLAIAGHQKWPLKYRPYALASSTNFRNVWLQSLDYSLPLPVLEWTVVVMDRGEMRSVGGLSIFNK